MLLYRYAKLMEEQVRTNSTLTQEQLGAADTGFAELLQLRDQMLGAIVPVWLEEDCSDWAAEAGH